MNTSSFVFSNWATSFNNIYAICIATMCLVVPIYIAISLSCRYKVPTESGDVKVEEQKEGGEHEQDDQVANQGSVKAPKTTKTPRQSKKSNRGKKISKMAGMAPIVTK